MKALQIATGSVQRLFQSWNKSSPVMSGKELSAALTTFFLKHERDDFSSLPMADDLRNWIYLLLGLTCHKCGRFDCFENVPRETGEEIDWAWKFAELADGQARQEGWSVEYDAQSHPLFYCRACQAPPGRSVGLNST